MTFSEDIEKEVTSLGLKKVVLDRNKSLNGILQEKFLVTLTIQEDGLIDLYVRERKASKNLLAFYGKKEEELLEVFDQVKHCLGITQSLETEIKLTLDESLVKLENKLKVTQNSADSLNLQFQKFEEKTDRVNLKTFSIIEEQNTKLRIIGSSVEKFVKLEHLSELEQQIKQIEKQNATILFNTDNHFEILTKDYQATLTKVLSQSQKELKSSVVSEIDNKFNVLSTNISRENNKALSVASEDIGNLKKTLIFQFEKRTKSLMVIAIILTVLINIPVSYVVASYLTMPKTVQEQ